MRAVLMFLVAVLTAFCGRTPELRQYELNGQILAIQKERNEVLIKHQDIEGFMPGMTMPFKVKDPQLLEGKAPGDLVTASLMVGDVEAYLSTLTRTGAAPLDTPPAVSDTPRILVKGDEVSDALLVDQDGNPRPFSTFRGHRVAITFIYTRCPLPEFCPLMDRHFATVQTSIQSDAQLADVRLVSVTLDPEFDTPQVLRPYARKLGADPAVWSFMTGKPEDVAAFSSQFGLYVERDSANAANIIHNLRTAIVDAGGRLVTTHTGNDWTPAQLVADLRATPAPAR